MPLEEESASADFLLQLRDFSGTFRLSEERQLEFVTRRTSAREPGSRPTSCSA